MAAFNGNLKKFNPRAPEKGSFPLDHLNECTDAKKLYMKCLEDNNKKIEACRELSMNYIQENETGMYVTHLKSLSSILLFCLISTAGWIIS